ncbi:MAG: PaaI family thioesterase [Woeseiaceae bacterium]
MNDKAANKNVTNYNEDLAHLTGFERVRRFASGEDGRFGASRYYGYTFDLVEEGHVCLGFVPSAEHLNLFKSVHGGVLAGLLDTAMGCALITLLNAGEHDTIIDLQTKFVRPVVIDGGPYTVDAKVEHRGRRQCTMSGRIVDAKGKLCVTATSAALIL